MPHRLSGHAALDSLSNLAASLNAGKDKQAGDAFFIPALARDQIESLYRGDWLARKIVDIVPYDCVREWRTWAGDRADVSRIESVERSLNLRRAVQRAMVMGRLYGGGALIIGTTETAPAALMTELRPRDVGPNGIAFLHAVSRWQLAVAEIERDPLSPWFGEPKAYEVTAPERGSLTLHPSRVIRFLGNPLADPSLLGADLWSDSVLTALYDAIHTVALTTTGATSLMHEAKVDVVTVPNLSEHLSNAATTAQLSARFSYAATMKSLNNLLLLGDGETWTRQRIDFAGLPEMVRTFLQVAAGAADIPVTRLLGQSPAGLSATGDHDTRNYYDMIAARQEIELRPQLERLDRLLLASAGVAPGALSFSFRPLWQMDAAAQAAVALQKAQTTQIYAGLGLWPTEVMAGLVRGQLAEDGIYPDAGAAFEAAETDGEPQAVRDYSPDQPRDPQGRWTEGGGTATIGTEGVAGNGVTAETPHNLTIHPKASQPSSSEGTRSASRSGTAPPMLAEIGTFLKFLNPISPAHAAGPEEDENRSAEGEADPMSGIREDLYYSAYNELKAIDPNNPEFGPVLRSSNWTPSNEDVRRVETALELALSRLGTPDASRSPMREEPDNISPFAPSSEQVNRAAPERQTTMPSSPIETKLERVRPSVTPGMSLGSSLIPEGPYGSVVRAEGITIKVEGDTAQELGHSYEQGIRTVFGSGRPGGTYLEIIDREVDDITDDGTILEGKHIVNYVVSIYNPQSLSRWPHTAIQRAIEQARIITSASEKGAVYFTNDDAFAREYKTLFEANGITRFRFVIAPSER